MHYFKGMYTWDLSALEPHHAAIVKGALKACDYPFGRIRRRTGKKVPVTVGDTSRFSQAAPAHGTLDHHGDDHDNQHSQGVHVLADHRKVALGLFWLPTPDHPAGRVELSDKVMGDTALAQEVFLAEAWHCVQYSVLTEDQRAQVVALFEHAHGGPEHVGEFEEQGEQDYWAWRGERGMGLFMAAFAPSLPRPMEAGQPWHHTYDQADIAAMRRVLVVR